MEETVNAPSVAPVQPIAPPVANLSQPELNAPHYAGGWIRFLATIIDGLILSLVSWLLGLIGLGNGNFSVTISTSAGASINSIINILYLFLFMALKQQTPGMMLLKLKLISLREGKPNWWLVTLLRQIVGGVVCGITLGIGYLIIFWTPKKQGLHDMIAGTSVIRE